MQAIGRRGSNKLTSSHICHVLRYSINSYIHLHPIMSDITKPVLWQRTRLRSLVSRPNIWLITACSSAKRDPLFNTQTRTVLMLQAGRTPSCHFSVRLIGRDALKQASSSFKAGEERVMSLFMLVINRSLSQSATNTRKLWEQLDGFELYKSHFYQVTKHWIKVDLRFLKGT